VHAEDRVHVDWTALYPHVIPIPLAEGGSVHVHSDAVLTADDMATVAETLRRLHRPLVDVNDESARRRGTFTCVIDVNVTPALVVYSPQHGVVLHLVRFLPTHYY